MILGLQPILGTEAPEWHSTHTPKKKRHRKVPGLYVRKGISIDHSETLPNLWSTRAEWAGPRHRHRHREMCLAPQSAPLVLLRIRDTLCPGMCPRPRGCITVPYGPGAGGQFSQAGTSMAPCGGAPCLGWSMILSGTEKFNDYKGEFNYTLSLTSSGDDGTIIHVIYQQDTCIHNKLKQNVKFQWQLKIQKKKKWAVVWSRLTRRRMWEQSYGAPLPLKK